MRNSAGKPYPSAGFTSAFVMAHEIGHNLGMLDSPGKDKNHPAEWECGLHGNIMGGNQRVEWSPCSVMDFRRMYTQYADNWCLEGMSCFLLFF